MCIRDRIKQGDLITVDAVKQLIEVDLSEEELEKRKKDWIKPTQKYKRGILSKYSKIVSTSSLGAVTDLQISSKFIFLIDKTFYPIC